MKEEKELVEEQAMDSLSRSLKEIRFQSVEDWTKVTEQLDGPDRREILALFRKMYCINGGQ